MLIPMALIAALSIPRLVAHPRVAPTSAEAPVIPRDAAGDERLRLDRAVRLLVAGRHAEALRLLDSLTPPREVFLRYDVETVAPADRAALARAVIRAESVWNRALGGCITFRTGGPASRLQILLRFEAAANGHSPTVRPEPPGTGFAAAWPRARSRIGRRVRIEVVPPSLAAAERRDLVSGLTARVAAAIGAYLGLSVNDDARPRPNSDDVALALRLIEVRERLIALARGKLLVTVARPKLVLNTRDVNIGEVREGDAAQFSFSLENRGSEMLELDVAPTCGCTAVTSDRVVPAGGTGHVYGELRTDGLGGAVTKEIELTTNDPQERRVILHVRGVVRPIVRILPSDGLTLPLREGTPTLATYEVCFDEGAAVMVTKATCDVPFASASVERLPSPPGAFRVIITISPEAPVGRTAVTTAVETSSSRRPEVTLHAICTKGILLSPAGIYLGVVPPTVKAPVTRVAMLSRAIGAFHVKRVYCRDRALVVGARALGDGGEWKLLIEYRGGWQPGAVRADVVVDTDDPRQPRIVVPVTASVSPFMNGR